MRFWINPFTGFLEIKPNTGGSTPTTPTDHTILDEILVDAGGNVIINAGVGVSIVTSTGTHNLHVNSVSTAEFN